MDQARKQPEENTSWIYSLDKNYYIIHEEQLLISLVQSIHVLCKSIDDEWR